MIVKIGNLPHTIGDGDKFMNTLLKDLNKLSYGLNMLYINGMCTLYGDDGSLIYHDIVKSSIIMDGEYVKVFGD